MFQKNRTKNNQFSSIKAGTPQSATYHDGIFETKEDAAKAIASTVTFLEKFSKDSSEQDGDTGKANKIGFIIENIG